MPSRPSPPTASRRRALIGVYVLRWLALAVVAGLVVGLLLRHV